MASYFPPPRQPDLESHSEKAEGVLLRFHAHERGFASPPQDTHKTGDTRTHNTVDRTTPTSGFFFWQNVLCNSSECFPELLFPLGRTYTYVAQDTSYPLPSYGTHTQPCFLPLILCRCSLPSISNTPTTHPSSYSLSLSRGSLLLQTACLVLTPSGNEKRQKSKTGPRARHENRSRI